MAIIINKDSGLDMHKETMVLYTMEPGIKKKMRTYTSMTNDLIRLKKWFQEAGITHGIIERS